MLTREDIKIQLQSSIDSKKPVIGVAVGSGFSAKQAVEGGADFILVLNAGRFRNYGVSSICCMMPFANSNELVLSFGCEEILPRIRNKPVIFGACATDPTIDHGMLLDKIKKMGFHGVNNFPTIGLIDGQYREALEENGLGYQREVEFMQKAKEKGLFTIAFVFDEDQAKQMAGVEVDVICAHLSWTVGGENSIIQRTSLEDGLLIAKKIFEGAKKVDPHSIHMVYGGPIKTPEQAAYFYKNSSAIGYIGGSSFERIPTEIIIRETTDNFKNYEKLVKENEMLKKELIKKKGFDEIVGQSTRMQEIYDIINKVADKNVNVLVKGESGTGKELIVRAIHYSSSRYKGPFIKVNCAALPDTVLESELFGHEKGAFTGAIQRRLGRFELANNGTLFLDEIGEMSLKTQAKLLRAIQEQEFQRVGGTETIKTDARIICATNVDIQKSVREGLFREDLYYRINVVSIETPPLRKHKEDISLLVNHFLQKIEKELGKKIKRIEPAAFDMLMNYDWPGNVRELKHILERAAILTDDDVIKTQDFPEQIRNQGFAFQTIPDESPSLKNAGTRQLVFEKELILDGLERFNWNRSKTAEYLGITRRTLYNKMTKLGISN